MGSLSNRHNLILSQINVHSTHSKASVKTLSVHGTAMPSARTVCVPKRKAIRPSNVSSWKEQVSTLEQRRIINSFITWSPSSEYLVWGCFKLLSVTNSLCINNVEMNTHNVNIHVQRYSYFKVHYCLADSQMTSTTGHFVPSCASLHKCPIFNWINCLPLFWLNWCYGMHWILYH